jgi:hypothetical protein
MHSSRRGISQPSCRKRSHRIFFCCALSRRAWDEDLQRALRTAVPSSVKPAQRFEATWAKVIGTFETHRPLWIANFEIFAQMVGQPATREVIASKVHIARAGLAAMFLNQDESTISEQAIRTVGTFYHVLLSGLIVQWLIDPASSLSAKNLTEALRATAENLKPSPKSVEKQAKSRASGGRTNRVP